MSNVSNGQPLNDGDGSCDPPLVDCAFYDDLRGAYVVTFVPRDEASPEPTEVAELPQGTEEFRRVHALFREINRVLAPTDYLEKIVHLGGANFTFHLRGGHHFELAEASGPAQAAEVSGCLKQIAVISEAAFLVAHAGHK